MKLQTPFDCWALLHFLVSSRTQTIAGMAKYSLLPLPIVDMAHCNKTFSPNGDRRGSLPLGIPGHLSRNEMRIYLESFSGLELFHLRS